MPRQGEHGGIEFSGSHKAPVAQVMRLQAVPGLRLAIRRRGARPGQLRQGTALLALQAGP